MIDRIPISDRAQWLELREQDVTASVAGALLGVHDYQTAYGLWAKKSRKVTDDVEESPAMLRGLLLEPVAYKLLQIEQPTWRLEWNGEPGTISGDYYRDPIHRIGATPDCFATDPARGRGVIQVKSVEKSIFRRKWYAHDDEDGGGPAEVQPPLWIAVQAIVEAHLTGCKWAAVAPLVIGFGLEMPIIDIPIHAGVIGKLQERVADFWLRVETGDAPDPDYGRDGETIAKLYGDDNGLEVDLRGDNELPPALEERETAMAARKVLSDRLDEIKAMIAHKLGSNAVGYLPGWQVSNKLQHRKEFTAKATSFRVVRAKRIAQATEL